MTNADPEVIARLNTKAEEILRAQTAIDERTSAFKAEEARLKDAYKADIQPLQEQIHTLEKQVVRLVNDNHAMLFEEDKQSFATVAVKFKLLHWKSKPKIIDEQGVLTDARKLSVIRKIADPPRIWTLNHGKFTKWLERNGDYRHLFEKYFTDESQHESLTLQPNNTHAVFHDTKRLTSPSVTIKIS